MTNAVGVQPHQRPTISEVLVDRLHQRATVTFPRAVLARTAVCIEDTLAVAFAAASLGVGTAATRLVMSSGKGPSTLWGTGVGTAAGEAALANGMLSHALDYDDLHASAIMHSSAVVVPAAVALAESAGSSGIEMLAATAVGLQVAAVLGRLAPGAFQQNGFQSTAVLGTFAAAAVAARFLGLSSTQAVNAFGIAGSMASGLMEFLADGSDVKQMHAGWAAQSGIRAAQLARCGFTGPKTVFEGRFGVFRSFAQKTVDASALDGLDLEHWEVFDMGAKPYPACLCVHPQVQAVLELRARGEVAPDRLDEITEIRCDVPAFYVPLVYEPAQHKRLVRTPYEARFSAAYCIARAILDGELTIASFAPAKLFDPRAIALAQKVTYCEDALPEFPHSFPARVTVIRRSGVAAAAYIPHNLGSPMNPLSAEQIDAKFLACSVSAIGNQTAGELLISIHRLPEDVGTPPFYASLRSARSRTPVPADPPGHS